MTVYQGLVSFFQVDYGIETKLILVKFLVETLLWQDQMQSLLTVISETKNIRISGRSIIPITLLCKICYRSSHRRCTLKKAVLKNFANFTGKHLCQSLFLNKVANLGPATLLKKGSGTGVLLRILRKSLRTLFQQNTSGRMLLMVNMKYNS